MQESPVVRVAVQLRDSAPTGVATLAHDLDLSRSSIENALNTLTGHDLVAREHSRPQGSGRPPRLFRFNSEQGIVAGIDIGTQSIRAIVADLAGTTLRSHDSSGVDRTHNPSRQLDAVISCLRQALTGLDATRLRALGVSLPGIVDDTGSLKASVVFPGWVGFGVGRQLQEEFHCPVVIDNGVRLAAVAEHHMGVARGFDDVLYLSVGARVAAGLILGGQPRRGAHNMAGDIGRVAFPGLNGPTGRIPWRRAATAKDVFTLAREGDVTAQEEVAGFITELGNGLATLLMTVDPAIVVVGGGLSLAHENLLDPLREAVEARLGMPLNLPILGSRFGQRVAVHGALIAAYRDCAEQIYRIAPLPPPVIHPVQGT